MPKRIDSLKIIIALSFFVGIIAARHLWVADRLYPLDPLLPLFLRIPVWSDYLLTPLLLISLLLTAISRKPKKYVLLSLGLAAFLFLEDRGRLFPSFYEYFLLLAVLVFYFFQQQKEGERSRAEEAALNACRLAIVFIYFWSGIQKINPFFGTQIAWVMEPVLGAVPSLRGWFINAAAIIAPFIEIEIGIGLLYEKTRRWALAEALFMHAALFVLIGPFFRSDWNAGAWAWNLASAFIVFILFFEFGAEKAPSPKEIFFAKDRAGGLIRTGIVVFFGILPALNFLNLWYSGPSFNVFGGNITQAHISITGAAAAKLPQEIRKYAEAIGVPENPIYVLNISRWSEDELRAEPYPESATYKNIAKFLCRYAPDPSDVRVTIYDKLTVFQFADGTGSREQYDCSTLSQ